MPHLLLKIYILTVDIPYYMLSCHENMKIYLQYVKMKIIINLLNNRKYFKFHLSQMKTFNEIQRM